jgi:hypothetical protein
LMILKLITQRQSCAIFKINVGLATLSCSYVT